ncbi:hypothetical protein [Cupriavidus sp. AU9028]|uniref:hypothetical protein n=1 Tax=Cupriavidus sp. AU9028 TaxID=2871157 RepID=UPI001C9414D3|nr:hypothetical protein [Cupriavidus sp. AU9028]MBY4898086.1 hypothetical protein [Cupriavidus sp. AU9028]
MEQQQRPWWREPWPWLLMSGPAAAMVACGVTIWLASTHADQPLAGVSRHGLVVEQAAAAAPHASGHGKAVQPRTDRDRQP